MICKSTSRAHHSSNASSNGRVDDDGEVDECCCVTHVDKIEWLGNTRCFVEKDGQRRVKGKGMYRRTMTARDICSPFCNFTLCSVCDCEGPSDLSYRGAQVSEDVGNVFAVRNGRTAMVGPSASNAYTPQAVYPCCDHRTPRHSSRAFAEEYRQHRSADGCTLRVLYTLPITFKQLPHLRSRHIASIYAERRGV